MGQGPSAGGGHARREVCSRTIARWVERWQQTPAGRCRAPLLSPQPRGRSGGRGQTEVPLEDRVCSDPTPVPWLGSVSQSRCLPVLGLQGAP